MMEYLITCRHTCPACNGEKHVFNPIYKEWASHMELWRIKNPMPVFQAATQSQTDHAKAMDAWKELEYAEECRWFCEQGYKNGAQYWPPDQYPCEDCEGTGVKVSMVSLDAALLDIVQRRVKHMRKSPRGARI